MTSLAALPNAMLFALLGLVLFLGMALLLARSLPNSLWQRATEKSDVAAALVIAAFLVGAAIIIAASVH